MKALNVVIQSAAARDIPPVGTPVRFRGEVVGSVAQRLHGQLVLCIEEEYLGLVADHFDEIDISIGVSSRGAK